MNLTSDSIATRNSRIKNMRKRRFFFPLGKDMIGSEGSSYATLGTDDSMMVASAVISTESLDRSGDVMRSLGCNIEDYKNNPVVLFGHGLVIPHPIGQAREGPGGEIWVYPEKNRVWAKCRFSESCKEGKQFYGMVKEGVLNATSVGWHPIKAQRRDLDHNSEPGTVQVQGWMVAEWALLEWSWCPIGMNPETLKLSWQADRIASIVSNGKYEGEPLSASFIKALTPYAAPRRQQVISGFALKKQLEPIKLSIKAMGTIADTSGGSLVENSDDMEPQAVRIPKDKFPDETDARKWAEAHSYKTDKPAHDDSHWVYEQFDAKEMEGDPREIDGEDGVKIVAGIHKSSASPISEEPDIVPDTSAGTSDSEIQGDKDPASADGFKDDDIESESPELAPPDKQEPGKKPGHMLLEQAEEIIDMLEDLLEQGAAMLEQPDVLEYLPEVGEAIHAIDEGFADLKTRVYGVKRTGASGGAKPSGNAAARGAKPDSTPPDESDKKDDKPEDDDKKKKDKHFIALWKKAKSAQTGNEHLDECLAVMKEVYAAQKDQLSAVLKQKMKRTYQRAKSLAPVQPEIDLSGLVSEAFKPIMERSIKLEEGLKEITGAA